MINLLKVRWAARMCRVLSLSPILETLCVCLRVPPGDEGNQNWTIERCSWSGMQPVYIHQRALWGGDDVHNAGSNQLGCLSSQIKWTAHSVRATLWDRWEDLCQPVPGEERGLDETNWILYHIGGSQTHQLFSWILNLTDFGQAHADGVGVACRGECPCPSDGDFHLIPISV